MKWHKLPPEIKEGSTKYFWCAVKNGYGQNGYVPLEYRNRYIADLSDDCCEVPDCAEVVDEDGAGEYYWTGWFENYTDETFHVFDGEVLAWADMPRDYFENP